MAYNTTMSGSNAIIAAIQCFTFFLLVNTQDCLAFIGTSIPRNQLNRRIEKSKWNLKADMEVWLDARDIPDLSRLTLDEAPDVVLVDASYSPHLHDFGSARFIYSQKGDTRLWKLDIKSVVGSAVEIVNDSQQNHAIASLGSVEWLLVGEGEWEMISAENLSECAKSTGTKIAFEVNRITGAGSLESTMELGVDAICVNPGKADEDLWRAVFQTRRSRNGYTYSPTTFTPAKIDEKYVPIGGERYVSGQCWRKSTKGTVLADGICIDFLQTLLPEEGCWIGSQADMLALVLAESSATNKRTRPFRVNGGPVHSYILLADQTVRYISDLEATDQILVHNVKTGSSRAVAVGRLKPEVQPCILVEFFADDVSDRVGQVFLKESDTVRLAQGGGTCVYATDMEDRPSKSGNKKFPIILRVAQGSQDTAATADYNYGPDSEYGSDSSTVGPSFPEMKAAPATPQLKSSEAMAPPPMKRILASPPPKVKSASGASGAAPAQSIPYDSMTPPQMNKFDGKTPPPPSPPPPPPRSPPIETTEVRKARSGAVSVTTRNALLAKQEAKIRQNEVEEYEVEALDDDEEKIDRNIDIGNIDIDIGNININKNVHNNSNFYNENADFVDDHNDFVNDHNDFVNDHNGFVDDSKSDNNEFVNSHENDDINNNNDSDDDYESSISSEPTQQESIPDYDMTEFVKRTMAELRTDQEEDSLQGHPFFGSHDSEEATATGLYGPPGNPFN